VPSHEDLIEAVASLVKTASSLLFITGAGISAESGLPTYRGIGGLYNNPDTDDGISIEAALSGQMFARRPQLSWKYIAALEETCRGATFNRAHEIIAELETHHERVCVLTQNVDGFHKQAGSKNVIDIHGALQDLRCPACHWRERVEDYSDLSIPPLCPRCSTVIRPDVVLFGELLPLTKVHQLERQLDAGFDMVFSIGTTSVFPYIAGPVISAKKAGVPTVEINPGKTSLSGLVDYQLPIGAAEACEAIWERL